MKNNGRIAPTEIKEAAAEVKGKEKRDAERKARAEEMLRRFNADLEELGCQWLYQELRHNGEVVNRQLTFVAE